MIDGIMLFLSVGVVLVIGAVLIEAAFGLDGYFYHKKKLKELKE